MGLPGHRRTSGDKRRNATHRALTATAVNVCPKCAKPVRPHRACSYCGTYRGRKVVNMDKKIARAAKK